ncbi:Inner centromere protein [Merluccius polli]|uniref:Inner centromere protein n=1 Tax=Merluccius polli TaxID=89951 RepID=A0AA47MXR7_MERPO|nr:Inner centromere protein [Merluccius polli]
MASTFSFVVSLKELFDGKLQQFMSDIDNVHMVWLNEIQQEANRMLTRFSKGKRSKLRGSSVKSLDLITEDEGIAQASTSGEVSEQPKRSTRRNKQTQPEVLVEAAAVSDCRAEQVPEEEPGVVDMELETAVPNTEIKIGTGEPQVCFSSTTPPKIPAPEVTVRISPTDRHSAELVAEPEASPGRNATKIAIARTPPRAERRSVRHSLKLRYSLAGLRHSMKQDAVRRTSRRSILKKKSARAGNSTYSSDVSGE